MESSTKVAAAAAEGKKERKEREKREKRERKEKEKEEKKRAQEQKKKDKEELKQQKKREKEDKKELKRKEKEDKRNQAKASKSNRSKPDPNNNVEMVATAPTAVVADEQSVSKEVVDHGDESKAGKQQQSSAADRGEPEAEPADVSDTEEEEEEEAEAEDSHQQHKPADHGSSAPAAVVVPVVTVTAAQDEEKQEPQADSSRHASAVVSAAHSGADHSAVVGDDVSHSQESTAHPQAAPAVAPIVTMEATEQVVAKVSASTSVPTAEHELPMELEKDEKNVKEHQHQHHHQHQEKEKEKETVATFKAPTPAVVEHVKEEPSHKPAVVSVNKTPSGAASGSIKKTHSASIEIEAPVTVLASSPPQRRAQPAAAAAAGPKGGVASRWQQAMDDNLSAKSQGLSDQMDDRVVKGVQWMDSQIRFLIAEIKKHGKPRADGKPAISFGALFTATIDTMPALAAAISTAKKRGVVEYEGDMLLQAVHDDVEITLLKDVIKDSPIDPSPRRKVPTGQSQSEPVLSNNEKCMACGKTAYPLERAVASGKVFHKQCFKCSVCKCVLKVIDYAHLDGIFYCQTHFQQLFLMNGDYKSGFNKAAEGVAVL